MKPPQIRSIHVEALHPLVSSVNLTQIEIMASFLIPSLPVTENMHVAHQQYCLSMISAKQEKTVLDDRDIARFVTGSKVCSSMTVSC